MKGLTKKKTKKKTRSTQNHTHVYIQSSLLLLNPLSIQNLKFNSPETTPTSNSTNPFVTAAPMAARIHGHVPPLRTQHFHQLRMGHRKSRPVGFQPDPSQRDAVGPNRESLRFLPRHTHRQAPRRFLPLAQRIHRLLRQIESLEKRNRRRAYRASFRDGRRRNRTRPLPLSMGSSRSSLREDVGVQRVLSESNDRVAYQVSSIFLKSEFRFNQRLRRKVRICVDTERLKKFG